MTDANIIHDAIEGASVHTWPEPDMTVLDNRRTPPDFPVESLGEWTLWVVPTAQSRSCPVDYVAVSLLSVLSSVIGNSRWVSPWEGWAEPPILWPALIGDPSSGKSPGVDATIALARELELDMAVDFPDQLLAWETKKVAAKEYRVKWESEVKDALEKGVPPPQMPEKAVEPDKPVRPRIIITDATIEASAKLLSQHPRGLLYSRDELAGWLESFNRYSGGGDRPFWIEAYGGRPYVVDRQKNDEPLRIPFLSISVVGGIQPDKLVQLLMGGEDDGLASRVLMAWPNPVPPKRPTQKPDNSMALSAMRRLHSLQMSCDDDGNFKPVIVSLDEAAICLLDVWRIDNAKHQKWASGLYLSHLGKMPGLVLRLSLILELMTWSWSPDGTPEPTSVSAHSFGIAADMIDEYFLPMAERAYGDAGLPKTDRHATLLARKILKTRPDTINIRDIQREWRLPGLKEAQPVHAACECLVDANWITATPSRNGETSGRNRNDFVVNPNLWRSSWEDG
jgi:hypothetical protein